MSAASEILHVTLLLGTIQGAVMTVLLWQTAPRRHPSRLFTALLALITLACLNLYLVSAAWMQANPVLRLLPDIIPLMIVMPVGPLLYLYVRAVLDPSFVLTRRHRWHFATAIIDLVPYLAAWTFIIGALAGLLTPNPEPWGLFLDRWDMYADIPRWLSLTTYLLLARQHLLRQRPNVAARTKEWRWMREFISVFLVFQCIHLVYMVPYIATSLRPGWWDAIGWLPVYLPLVVMIYWLGFKGYQLAFREKKAVKGIGSVPAGLVEKTLARLRHAMQQEYLYLDPALNLSILANHLDIPLKTLSTILNQHLHKSFNEFMNDHRVEAFKRKVAQAGFSHLTMTGIALECGFSSQATFQRIFKQYTGLTPSEYRKQLQ